MPIGFCGVFCSGRQRYHSSGGWKMQRSKLCVFLFFIFLNFLSNIFWFGLTAVMLQIDRCLL